MVLQNTLFTAICFPRLVTVLNLMQQHMDAGTHVNINSVSTGETKLVSSE